MDNTIAKNRFLESWAAVCMSNKIRWKHIWVSNWMTLKNWMRNKK